MVPPSSRGKRPQTDRVLWRYLHEGWAAIIVGREDFDMLIEPIRTGRSARLRNELLQRITVEVSYRHKDAPPPPTPGSRGYRPARPLSA
jgi:hypothetical protein